MKPGLWVRLVVAAACLLIVAGSAITGIAGSDHDFSSQGWSAGKICSPCHTPHGATTSVADAPLWNHEVTAATYTLYSSSTLDSSVGQPEGRSKLCLSCHDGTVAIDNFGGFAGGTVLIPGKAAIGTDLADDHPISLTYDTSLASADGELHDPATTITALGGTIADDLLIGGRLECASCHDVHDTSGNQDLLRIDNSGSALCLTCHDK